ncbi:unnamed protein product [Prorocentrum cordatum]|uniref:Uncharacterized protein n=1 Tax=Prorocentrum cordatum TaxID=2364126 RepID=A0ABN9X066_9DINO|nr:unnamed protein product [Polarella glacialis]
MGNAWIPISSWNVRIRSLACHDITPVIGEWRPDRVGAISQRGAAACWRAGKHGAAARMAPPRLGAVAVRLLAAALAAGGPAAAGGLDAAALARENHLLRHFGGGGSDPPFGSARRARAAAAAAEGDLAADGALDHGALGEVQAGVARLRMPVPGVLPEVAHGTRPVFHCRLAGAALRLLRCTLPAAGAAACHPQEMEEDLLLAAGLDPDIGRPVGTVLAGVSRPLLQGPGALADEAERNELSSRQPRIRLP